MKFKQEPVKNQKFEIGRTINFMKCGTYEECKGGCDYMHCPNYARKMKQVKYKVEEFYEENKEILSKPNCFEKNDLIVDFMDACVRSFPRGTYWDTDGYYLNLVTRSTARERKVFGDGDFVTKVKIDLYGDFDVHDWGGSESQLSLANSISNKLRKLKGLAG